MNICSARNDLQVGCVRAAHAYRVTVLTMTKQQEHMREKETSIYVQEEMRTRERNEKAGQIIREKEAEERSCKTFRGEKGESQQLSFPPFLRRHLLSPLSPLFSVFSVLDSLGKICEQLLGAKEGIES